MATDERYTVGTASWSPAYTGTNTFSNTSFTNSVWAWPNQIVYTAQPEGGVAMAETQITKSEEVEESQIQRVTEVVSDTNGVHENTHYVIFLGDLEVWLCATDHSMSCRHVKYVSDEED